jgi:triphosphoribosyl-dephospho-CoA synthase
MTKPSAGLLAAAACVLEVSARKAGNVHPCASFEDAHAVDFLMSAVAIAGPLDRARAEGVGLAAREAVRATGTVAASNTNLGMILLLTPLVAAEDGELHPAGLGRLLDRLTVADSLHVFEAIRLASPGGLGSASDQDVADAPTLPLRPIMRLAADRDLVARQYAEAFVDVFGVGLDALAAWLDRGIGLERAIVGTHLSLIAALGDSLIARKRGPEVSDEARALARSVIESGWPSRLDEFDAFDAWLRADGHARNPGATADLTAAVIHVGLRKGLIRLPVGAWSR